MFTGVLVLVLALLIFATERLSSRERIWLVALAAFMIAAHQSHVLLAFVLLTVLLPMRGLREAAVLQSVLPLALAAVALMSVNLIAFGRASMAPFSNVFVLTRVIYDGPGTDVLRRDCPASGWRLCAFIDRLPAMTDDFLWRADGPVVQSGGAKVVSREADAIIAAALRAEPGRELRAVGRNAMQQLARFATGDGLQPWPGTVTPRIERDFPRFEAETYAASRQNSGSLEVPTWFADVASRRGACRHRGVRRVAARGIAQAACRQRFRRRGAARAAGERGDHRRSLRTARSLPVPRHVAAAIGRGAGHRLAANSRQAGFQAMTRGHAANVFWSGLEAAVSAVLAFASAFIVARLVGLAEVGIGAAAVAVHILLWVCVNALFADALVQRSVVDEATFSSSFAVSVAVGCLAAVLQAALGRPLAWSLGDSLS